MALKTQLRKTDRLLTVLLFTTLIVLSRHIPGIGWDHKCWLDWVTHISRNGIANAYGALQNNFMPLSQYMFYLFGKMVSDETFFDFYLPLMRVFPLFFEFAGIWYIYNAIDRKLPYIDVLLLCTLNAAYLYNTLVFGQFDGLYSSVAFVAVYYAYKGRNVISTVCMLMALNFKLQAIAILPLWGLMFLYNIIDKKAWKELLASLVVAAFVQALILLPFAMVPGKLNEVWNMTSHLSSYFPNISMRAFNLWYLIIDDPYTQPDSDLFMAGLTYKQAGLILFASCYLFALLPLIRTMIASLRNKPVLMPERTKIWIMAALCVLSFFFFNTEMHERYSHAAMIFLAAYGFFTRDYIGYILFSVAYLLNLEAVAMWLGWSNYAVLMFSPHFIATLYAVLMLYLFVKLYRKPRKTLLI